VALLGNPNFLEASFARLVLDDGVGLIAIYSHRVYGKEAAETIGQWLETKGPAVEKTLMACDKMPSLAVLNKLPQKTSSARPTIHVTSRQRVRMSFIASRPPAMS
jgi:hypothetical protein